MKTLLVPVYREPDENAPLLKRLPADTTVTVIARADPWLFIQFAPEEHGYIRASEAHPLYPRDSDASPTSSPVIEPSQTSLLPYIVSPATSSLSVPVFCEPSLNAQIIGNLDAGARVEVISQDASWFYIQFSPEQRGYIEANHAHLAGAEELIRSEEALAPKIIWSEVKQPYPFITPALRYIVSPTGGGRAAVYREANQGSELFDFLEPDTIVEVIWKSEFWLCIQRSPGEYGYIKAMDATPFSGKEKPYRSTYSSGLSPRMGYSTGSYNDSKAKARPWFRATRLLIGFGIFLLFGGAILGSIQEQVCAFIFCQTTYPFAQLAEVCYVFGFILLAIGVVTLITALVIRASP